jgi:hypothetical protein
MHRRFFTALFLIGLLLILSSCQEFRPGASALVILNGQSIHISKWEEAEITPAGSLYNISVKARSNDNRWVLGGLGTIKTGAEIPYTFDVHAKESIWALSLIYYPNPKSEINRITYNIGENTTGSITINQVNHGKGGNLQGSLSCNAVYKTDYMSGETTNNHTMKAKFQFELK